MMAYVDLLDNIGLDGVLSMHGMYKAGSIWEQKMDIAHKNRVHWERQMAIFLTNRDKSKPLTESDNIKYDSLEQDVNNANSAFYKVIRDYWNTPGRKV